MKLVKHLILLLFPCVLAAQDLPTPIVGTLFAQPGIRNGSPGRGFSIEYERQPKFRLSSKSLGSGETLKNDVEAKERFEVKLKFPLLLKNNWKVLGDLYHSYERYYFESINPKSEFALKPIDGLRLHRTRLTGYVFKSFSQRNYLALRFEASSNGGFEGLANFDRRYMVYRLAAILGVKKNEDSELGFGVMLNDNFGRYTALPFIVYNRNFSEKWGMESILPIRLKLRHNLNERNLLSFAAEYWSSAYSLDLQIPGDSYLTPYIFKSSSVQTFVEWETNKFSEWTWFALRGGVSYNFDSRFILPGTRNDGRIDAFPSTSIFVSGTFFIAPPKDYLDEKSNRKQG
ncbi:MAG: hypothetical protein GC192_15815 [Bacteroidetes bacterium]|nr:hypothetical protein [Bacteroidota bacterium]